MNTKSTVLIAVLLGGCVTMDNGGAKLTEGGKDYSAICLQTDGGADLCSDAGYMTGLVKALAKATEPYPRNLWEVTDIHRLKLTKTATGTTVDVSYSWKKGGRKGTTGTSEDRYVMDSKFAVQRSERANFSLSTFTWSPQEARRLFTVAANWISSESDYRNLEGLSAATGRLCAGDDCSAYAGALKDAVARRSAYVEYELVDGIDKAPQARQLGLLDAYFDALADRVQRGTPKSGDNLLDLLKAGASGRYSPEDQAMREFGSALEKASRNSLTDEARLMGAQKGFARAVQAGIYGIEMHTTFRESDRTVRGLIKLSIKGTKTATEIDGKGHAVSGCAVENTSERKKALFLWEVDERTRTVSCVAPAAFKQDFDAAEKILVAAFPGTPAYRPQGGKVAASTTTTHSVPSKGEDKPMSQRTGGYPDRSYDCTVECKSSVRLFQVQDCDGLKVPVTLSGPENNIWAEKAAGETADKKCEDMGRRLGKQNSCVSSAVKCSRIFK